MDVLEKIKQEIHAAGGFLPFDRYMHLALYTPGLGYYAKGVPMSGASGAAQADFTTAPELTPLFGQTLARQLTQLFEAGVAPHIMEFGAGTGKLARDVLQALTQLGHADVGYSIVDVSGSLRAAQQATLQEFDAQVQWLNALPASFEGVVLGNEVLDAMPCSVFALRDGQVFERGVTMAQNKLVWADNAVNSQLEHTVSMRFLEQNSLEKPIERAWMNSDFVSEINFQAEAFMRTLGGVLTRGAVLMIDYGFPRHEYYHPQRNRGTLMCHARQRTHDDPLHAPGQEDITAHVDFTAMRDAALESGLQLAGYTGQARFLLNCGVLDLAAQLPRDDALAYAKAVAPLQKLLSEAEMGELFKVIGFAKGINVDWMGFARGDRSGNL
jgi:SAM-dependent MidA family methyltransferase